MRFAIIAVAVWPVGLALWGAKALRPVITADDDLLAFETSAPAFVEVTCGRVDPIGQFTDGTHAYACATGGRVLPVLGIVEGTAPGTRIVGELHPFSTEYQWPLDLRDTAGYLEVRSSALRSLRRAAGVVGLSGLLALGVGFGLVRRRRRRAAR